MDRNHDVINFFQKDFTLRRPGGVIFADIIKIVNIFINATLKGSKKLEELKIMYLNAIYIFIS